ncbi:MAG: hypothetical protein JWP16_2429, partial [Alphaproteobacteria bacterium]|nr:hypothetical protein [Alphaproteobacteria bacterium]
MQYWTRPKPDAPLKLPFTNYIKAHHISRAALTAGVLVAAVVFFVVGAGLRLLWGPVSLGPLRGTLAGAIHDALPGIALDYNTAAIEWTRDQNRVNLVVLGARLYDSHGKVVATAPKADIDLAAAPFLKGHFVVKRITLVGVEFGLVHMKSGRIRLGSEQDVGDDDIIRRIRDVIDARGSSSGALESFAVRDARLAIFDEVTGLYVTAPHASVIIRARGQATGASFDSNVVMGGRTSHITADITLPAGRGDIRGNVNVTGLDLRGLGAAGGIFSSVKKLPVILGASANFTVASGGALALAAFDVNAHGDIPWAALKDKLLHVQGLRVVGHYDGAPHHLTLSSITLNAKEARAALKGSGDFFLDPDGKLERVHAELSGKDIALDMPGIYAQPVGYQALAVAGDYLAAPRQFNITKLSVSAKGFALDGSGSVTLNDTGAPGLVAKARIGALPIRTLLHYWPLPVAP